MTDKKSIVAVDDSGLILKVLEKLLNEEYDYHGFVKGMRALKYLKDSGRPDLIILDIDMPEINGYEMLEMIREKDELKDVPVLFLTSNSDKEYVVKAIKSGADDYTLKPIDKEVFMDKVHKLLKDEEKKLSWDNV